MSERENGWYLRSDGYMTSKCSYQRIDAVKGNRALDNHQKLVFVKFMGGEEVDSRVYVPHPGTCHMSFIDEYEPANGEEEYLCECSECGCRRWESAYDLPLFCSKCGRKVER